MGKPVRSGPEFHLGKFYRLRCNAGQFGTVARTLRKVDQVMKERLSTHRRGTLLLLAAIVLGFIVTALIPSVSNLPALAFSLCGLSFIYIIGGLRMLFMRGKPPINRFVLVFGLLNPGIFIYMGSLALLRAALPDLDARAHPVSCVAALAISTLVIVFTLRLTSGMRWKKLAPQEVELDYVERIVRPLLADLPKGARSDVLFNPFAGEWSRVAMPPRERPGYAYESFADILLRLRVPLDETRTLKVSIHEFTVSKTKNRKSKYKGTKHALVVRYDIPLPSGAQANAAELKAAMAKALAGSEQGAATISAKDGKLTICQVKKTGDMARELLASHLLPVETVLKTVAFMSRASISLASSAAAPVATAKP